MKARWELSVWAPTEYRGNVPNWQLQMTSDEQPFEVLLAKLMAWSAEGQSVRLEYSPKPIREEGAIPSLEELDSRTKERGAVTKEILQMIPNKKYRIRYKSDSQKYLREAVMVHMDFDGNDVIMSARPIAGTQHIPMGWIEDVKEVSGDSTIYLNVPAGPNE